ncbi:MAG: T9SS type A sorting domain-containing protein, partial [Ignavibacteriae bacterium]|nr:T9SS type A sorting domain-containing protein [Ignavibacteriota bacterium]
SHGAEGLGWYVYQNTDWQGNSLSINQAGGHHFLNSNVSVLPYDYTHYNFGLFNVDSTKRSSNVTGQNKWDYVSKMNKTILNWKPTLDKITWTSGYSVHSETATHEFIYDIKSIKRDPYHEYIEDSPCTFCDAPNERYWEMGFFEPDFDYPTVSSTDKSKYFLMVNRRCVPDTPTSGQGDFRSLRIKFDSTQLSGFTNWKITELDTNNVITTFNKNTASFINMGEFKPGEGKLYKLAPVMQEGGTLVADESVSGSFDCKGLVNNGGKNITLIPGTTINFANSDARIVMNGGNFKSGINTGDNTAPVNLQGKEDTLWKGLVFQDCPSVEMYKTYFKNISPYEMDSTYAIDLVNCLYSKIDGCSFQTDSSLNSGGIRANFTSNNEYPVEAYILNSTFQMEDGNIPALSFISSGGITVPLIIDGNTFTSDEGNSANAIFLCNVSGGAIKNNTITDYKTGVFMLSSAMDFFNNVIDGSSDNSVGIKGASQSNLSLGTSGNYYTAGLNTVSSEGSTGKCVYVYKSSFDLHKGENIFDLKNYNSNDSYHLSGTFPYYLPNTTLSAVQNCFRISGVNNSEIQNVKWVNGNFINFDFLDYSCEVGYESEKLIVDLGNDNKDTIYYKSGGSGGSISNLQSTTEISSAESLIDSININTRKRNYNRVISDCQDYLSNHLNDSSNTGDQSSGIISKLFLASSRLDVAGNKITALKTLLENLILNNPQNESLIKSAFYYIQKCKVKLEDYESAMTGFQQIMDQNPYTYESLTASWDYSASYLLLLNQSGSGGGISNYKLQISNDELIDDEAKIDDNNQSKIQNSNSQILYDDPREKYDKNVFTKDDRKILKSNIFNSFETSRDKEIEVLKTLEKKVSEGNANESEKKELETKKVLKEIAKPKKPVNISEHISNVSGDINKITDAGKGSLENKNASIVPEVYYLSQNYPNPFNPTTKISFDLPVDAKVKLIIFDMLGREVKSMVNSQLSTGRYEYQFEGSNFSSGIYFYRMEAVDNSGKKFVQTKRMVLVK